MSSDSYRRRLPAGWVWTTLAEVCLPVAKVAPEDAPEESFSYIDIASIDNSRFRIARPKIYLGKDAPSRARQRIASGDLLFSTVRTYLRNIALVPPEYDGEVASTGFCVLRPSAALHPRFLFYAAQTDDFISSLNPLQRGTSYPAVRNDDVLAQGIALPPLAEQHRIVGEIEKHFTRLDAAVVSLQRARANLKRYRASVLRAASEGYLVPTEAELSPGAYEPASVLLERILRERRARWEVQEHRRGKYREPRSPDTSTLPPLPDGWVWGTVDEVADLVTDGDHNPPPRVPKGIPHLTAKNVKGWGLVLDGCSFITEADYERVRARYEPRPGDLIITCVGTIGESAVVPPELRFSPDRNLAAVRLIEPGLDTKFVQIVLSSSRWRELMVKASGSTAQPHLYLRHLRALEVPIPPPAEQQRIVAEVERHLSVIQVAETVVETNLKRAGRLRQAILLRAFDGKLVPQDPADEPTSVVLEHIRVEREQARRNAGQPRGKIGRRQKTEQVSL